MTSMDPEVLALSRDGMYLAPDAFGARDAAAGYLARRRCPVLAVYSTHRAAAWERTTVAPARSRTVEWEGCGHYLHEERPRALVTSVDDWTRALPAARPA